MSAPTERDDRYPLRGTKTDIGYLAGDARAVGVSMMGKHHGQAVNQVVDLRHSGGGQRLGQDRPERLKSRLQTVQAQGESLMARQAWEPVTPIVFNQTEHPLFLKAAL
jgi:hypothetical protein